MEVIYLVEKKREEGVLGSTTEYNKINFSKKKLTNKKLGCKSHQQKKRERRHFLFGYIECSKQTNEQKYWQQQQQTTTKTK